MRRISPPLMWIEAGTDRDPEHGPLPGVGLGGGWPAWTKKIAHTHAMEHLISHAIYDGEGHLGAVFGGVVMHTEWPLTEGRIDDFHDRSCHATRVGVVGDDSAKRLLDLVAITGIRARFVCRDANKIRRSPGVGEMVGALREGARHDDRGFDAPEG